MIHSFRVLLALAVSVTFGFQVQAQNALLLDVYSVKVSSDVAQEKWFGLWTKSLKAGGESSHEHDPINPRGVPVGWRRQCR